ncbi:CDP-glycerol glycerophosphotransferase family protein, partial [Microbacterium sp. Mu-80]
YAVNKDAAEAPRLRHAGANLVYAGSIRLALHYLHAKVIFTTHPNPATTTGLTQFGPFLRDMNNSPIVCIQHGLSMQELGRSMHQGHAGIERYYCASRYEIANIGTPEYGYAADQLVLTGIPRFDGLPVDSERVVMISPTWRPEYAAPSPGENNRRPANEDFLNSLYFDRFSALLTSRALLEEAEARGFSIRFMIHPTLATNHEYFRQGLNEVATDKGVGDIVDKVVSVGAAGIDTSYDVELKRARLLVTDYSGIQYDFAYMRKAIVYFHDSDMPPQYGDGAMDYPTMGFGPIAPSVDTLVDHLLDALGRDCAVADAYTRRYETFFEFDDRLNCQRIHEDVESWLAENEVKGNA